MPTRPIGLPISIYRHRDLLRAAARLPRQGRVKGAESWPSQVAQSWPSRDPVVGPSRGTQSNEELSLAERIVLACEEPKSVKELLVLVGRTNRTKFKQRFLGNLRIDGVLEWTIPDKPNSRLQKYRLTAKGLKLVASFKKKGGRK